MTRIGSLFSGYGGLDMAVQSVFGGALAWWSDIEPASVQVMTAHHPGVPNLGDITKVDWASVAPVDILTGGYPCQPFSHAGLRKGKHDERHLWPYVCAAIGTLRPRLVVLENVYGHLTLGFADVLADLARVGYDARWGVVRAADAGAPHGRKRLFIVAHPDGTGLQGSADRESLQDAVAFRGLGTTDSDSDAADANGRGRDEGIDQPGHLGQENRAGATAVPHGHCADGAPADADRAAGPEPDERSATGGRVQLGNDAAGRDLLGVAWGKYEPAIRRWERLTRPAPTPTVDGRNGRPRLNPAFVEWMMGLPAGHVTGHGLRPAQELKMLGNGVVPQQAALALSMLLTYANALLVVEESAA